MKTKREIHAFDFMVVDVFSALHRLFFREIGSINHAVGLNVEVERLVDGCRHRVTIRPGWPDSDFVILRVDHYSGGGWIPIEGTIYRKGERLEFEVAPVGPSYRVERRS